MILKPNGKMGTSTGVTGNFMDYDFSLKFLIFALILILVSGIAQSEKIDESTYIDRIDSCTATCTTSDTMSTLSGGSTLNLDTGSTGFCGEAAIREEWSIPASGSPEMEFSVDYIGDSWAGEFIIGVQDGGSLDTLFSQDPSGGGGSYDGTFTRDLSSYSGETIMITYTFRDFSQVYCNMGDHDQNAQITSSLKANNPADYQTDVSGPDQVKKDSTNEFSGSVENIGSSSGDPGSLTIEKEGDNGGNSWNVGSLSPDQTYQRSRDITFSNTGDYQVCTELSGDTSSSCKTVTVSEAEFDVEITGPDEVSSGSVAQFFGTVENAGSFEVEPGILTVEKDGDDGGESWNAGNLNPGESFEEGRFVSFGSAGTYQLCAQVTDDSASDCKTVTATDSGGPGGWKNLVNFELDLTGPDSGIGWDEDDGAALDIEARDGRKVVFTDIYWQGFDTDNYWGSGGPLSTYLNEHEAPMCGDDQREYLLEEIGESTNSEKFNGRYACADSYEYCVFRGKTGRKIFEREETVNTDEDTEQEGRLKLDDEVCAQRPGLESTSMTRDFDITPIWYDQDYANEISGTGDINVPDQNLCRENNLYGPSGARWINKDYIQDYPNSVTGGIDDSWNPELERRGHPSLESRPDQSTYSNNIIDNGNTPVDTGTLGSKVARPTNMDYGFCGGDDSSEYLIYQDSQTDLVETDQEVIGVASDPNSCVLENSRVVNSEDGGVRDLYEEGESVSFDSGDTRRTIQCFDGQWWGEWPIVFYEDVSRFDLGETGFIPFMVINPTDESRELNLDLNPRGPESEDINQITSFESTGGDEMVLTVPAESSVTQRLEISANREIDTTGQDSQHIAVIGESTNGNLDGEDRVDLVVEANDGTGSSSNIRDIPGLTFIQIIFIALVSTMMFIFRN